MFRNLPPNIFDMSCALNTKLVLTRHAVGERSNQDLRTCVVLPLTPSICSLITARPNSKRTWDGEDIQSQPPFLPKMSAMSPLDRETIQCQFAISFEHVSRHWKVETLSYAVVLFNDRSAVLAIIHLWRRRLRCWLVNLTTILAQWLLHFYQEPIHALQAECISRGLSIQDIITEADTKLIMNDPQTVHLLDVGVRKVQEFGARCLQTQKHPNENPFCARCGKGLVNAKSSPRILLWVGFQCLYAFLALVAI